MFKKSSDKKDNTLIDDFGIIQNGSKKRTFIFVALCRILSILLIILGIVTILNP